MTYSGNAELDRVEDTDFSTTSWELPIDPIRWELPYWFQQRVSLPILILTLAIRPAIFRAIRKSEENWDLQATEGRKSRLARYRSEIIQKELMLIAQYMSSLIPQERGFLWSIHEVVYGDEEKEGRKPVTAFIQK